MIHQLENQESLDDNDHDHGHFHGHDRGGDTDHHEPHRGHAHTHGIVDPSILTTERGIRAVKWSFAGLFLTAIFQVIIVSCSGSIALLADTIHNFGDALTAIPHRDLFTTVFRSITMMGCLRMHIEPELQAYAGRLPPSERTSGMVHMTEHLVTALVDEPGASVEVKEARKS